VILLKKKNKIKALNWKMATTKHHTKDEIKDICKKHQKKRNKFDYKTEKKF